MKRVLLALLPCLFVANLSMAQGNVKISGKAPDYANMVLPVEQVDNFILNSSRELKRFTVGEDGTFSTEFVVDDTSQIFIPLGQLQGSLNVEPNKSYTIALPRYIPLRPQDELNPFFKPEELLLGVIQEDDDSLNYRAQEFDIEFEKQFNSKVQMIIIGQRHDLIDEIINRCDNLYPAENGSWFYNYKYYNYVRLWMFKKRTTVRDNAYNYFAKRPVMYNLPSYWKAFNLCFVNFVENYTNTKESANFIHALGDSISFLELKQTLKDDPAFGSNDLAELLTMKGIYELYYSKQLRSDKIIRWLEEASKDCANGKNRFIATELLAKVNTAREGTKAAEFTLKNLKDKDVSLSDFEGKYVYLNFASIKNYACQKDFDILQEISKEYKKNLRVVSIVVDNDMNEVKEYVKQHNYDWEILFNGIKGNVLFDYGIRGYPSYFLIDPEGELILSPAILDDDFLVYLDNVMIAAKRKKNIEENKKQNDENGKRSIFDL